jgi:hypothetical protein
MAAMLVPLPETSSDSNTLVLGHYPASHDPMTNSDVRTFISVHTHIRPIRWADTERGSAAAAGSARNV